MRWKKTLQLLDVHCEGEIGKIITSGAYDIPGATIADKLFHINNVDDTLRRFVIQEPRGSVAGSVNLLLSPSRPDADAAFLVLQADEAHPMSGSNAMCVVTGMLETGMIEMQEPVTSVRLETAAGMVAATAHCRDGKCEKVSLDMIPAFVERLDAEIENTSWGTIKVDISFGGVYYALVDVDQLGLKIEPGQARDLVSAGMELKRLVNNSCEVEHPLYPEINKIAYVMFRDRDEDGAIRTCTTLWPGRVDRSPCGTGSSANLACLHARGQVSIGDHLTTRSIIGSTFGVDLLGTTRVGDRPAVLPRVTGRCWIFGMHQMALDPTDPFQTGFTLSDTWGPEIA